MNFAKLSIGLVIVCIPFMGATAAGTTGDSERIARDSAERYANALFQGDIATLRSDLLTEALKRKFGGALDRPSYAKFLADIYRDATYEITCLQEQRALTFNVCLEITENEDEAITRILSIKVAADLSGAVILGETISDSRL